MCTPSQATPPDCVNTTTSHSPTTRELLPHSVDIELAKWRVTVGARHAVSWYPVRHDGLVRGRLTTRPTSAGPPTNPPDEKMNVEKIAGASFNFFTCTFPVNLSPESELFCGKPDMHGWESHVCFTWYDIEYR